VRTALTAVCVTVRGTGAASAHVGEIVYPIYELPTSDLPDLHDSPCGGRVAAELCTASTHRVPRSPDAQMGSAQTQLHLTPEPGSNRRTGKEATSEWRYEVTSQVRR